MGGHEGTHRLESALIEGMGRHQEVRGLRISPHPAPSLDEALRGLGEPVVRRPEFQAWICLLTAFKQLPPLLSSFLHDGVVWCVCVCVNPHAHVHFMVILTVFKHQSRTSRN